MTLAHDYQAALDYIFNYVDYERRRSVPYTEAAWDLDRTRQVLAALGNPHQSLRIVHVAGSKGKGSTAAMVEAVLRACGLRTGFFASPHLHTVRERIRVDGELMGQDALVRLLDECRPAIEAVAGITTFEIMTVLALLYFARRAVDWTVLEVGLGGRLDATNVVTPDVSVITPISYEHTALLGHSLDQIAREKAGIVKKGVPVVSAPQRSEALAAIDEACRAQQTSLDLVGRDWWWQSLSDGLDGQVFNVERRPVKARASDGGDGSGGVPWAGSSLGYLRIPLLGSYQVVNATSAVAACSRLSQAGAPIDEASLRLGLAQVCWPARLEVLRRPGAGAPAIAVDSAHNVASLELLLHALASYFPHRQLHLVFGVSSDKDIERLVQAVAPAAQRLICTRSRHPRALDPVRLATAAGRAMDPECVAVADTVQQALWVALERAGSDAIVCAAGSLFVAAEAREAWFVLHPEAFRHDDWVRQAEPPDPSWQVAQSPSGNLSW